MNINCPKCTTQIEAKDINIDKAIAVCASCHHFFRLDNQLEENYDPTFKKVYQAPEGISSKRAYNALEIDLKLSKITKAWWEFWFGFIFLIFPTGFYLVFRFGNPKVEGSIFMLFAILGIFFAVGGYMTWGGLCKILNTTTVRVGSQFLEVYSQPISSGKYKKRQYPISEIEQVFVRQYSNKSQNERPIYEYAVDFLSTKEGKTAWIVKGLSKPELAWYIEQKIEDYLGLQDKKVLGEFNPSHNYRPSASEVLGFVWDKWKNRGKNE